MNTNKELENHVKSIAKDITNGTYDFETGEYDEPCAADYIKDVLDIEYIVTSNKEYIGARLLVAFGGPNIWINTRTKTVEGYWWGEQAFASFDDNLGLDDFMSEMWECSL